MKDEAYYFHQTPKSLCHELVKKLDLNPTDCVFEPFAGEGNWVRSFGMDQNIIQTEIENGSDYRSIDLETTKVDWIITNPPYQLDEGASENAFYKLINLFAGKTNKGIAFLGNDRCLAVFTPPRLKNLYETKGIYLHKIVGCSVKKWRGMYFFLIFKNKPSKPCCNGCKDKKPCESEAHHSHDHAPPTEYVRFDFFDFVEGDFE